MSDALNASTEQIFTLYGCREVLRLTTGAAMFEQQLTLLERSVYENPQIAFDTARTLIETTCKTILYDRGKKPDESGKIEILFKETIDSLQILPNTHVGQTDLDRAIKDTLSTLQQTVVNIGRVRNKGGFVSHGKDGYSIPLQDTAQAQFVARAADAVIHFLYSAHLDLGGSRAKPIQYSDNPEFNDYVDETYSELTIEIFDIPFQPSAILFSDSVAYESALKQYQSEKAGQGDET